MIPSAELQILVRAVIAKPEIIAANLSLRIAKKMRHVRTNAQMTAPTANAMRRTNVLPIAQMTVLTANAIRMLKSNVLINARMTAPMVNAMTIRIVPPIVPMTARMAYAIRKRQAVPKHVRIPAVMMVNVRKSHARRIARTDAIPMAFARRMRIVLPNVPVIARMVNATLNQVARKIVRIPVTMTANVRPSPVLKIVLIIATKI